MTTVNVNVLLVIGQLPKRRLTSATFFLKVELFSTLRMAEKNAGRGRDFLQKRSAP